MKTLDEVIKAFEICDETVTANCPDCPYDIDCENVPGEGLRTDALHYLKEYRDRKETLRNWTEKAISEQQNIADAYMLYKIASGKEKDNLPLTWDELRQMAGKPVWVETKYYSSRWAVITDVDDVRIGFVGKQLLDSEIVQEMGESWQAYRKER